MCKIIEYFTSDNIYLKCYPLLDRQPMKCSESVSSMIVFTQACYNTSSRVLYELNLGDLVFRKSV